MLPFRRFWQALAMSRYTAVCMACLPPPVVFRHPVTGFFDRLSDN